MNGINLTIGILYESENSLFSLLRLQLFWVCPNRREIFWFWKFRSSGKHQQLVRLNKKLPIKNAESFFRFWEKLKNHSLDEEDKKEENKERVKRKTGRNQRDWTAKKKKSQLKRKYVKKSEKQKDVCEVDVCRFLKLMKCKNNSSLGNVHLISH